MQEYPDVFEDFPTDASHQIGGCQVEGGFLYVGVGDGFHPAELPLGVDSPQGKMLRFTLDGQPAADNPFRQDGSLANPANYVWALGFRNPFALKSVGGQLFVAENGGQIDRLVRIERGADYFWNGNDLSIGARADVIFTPSIAPVQLDFFPADFEGFPAEYSSNFYMSATGRAKGIFRVPYDLEQNTAAAASTQFLSYLGASPTIYSGMVTALAFGPDALYFAPLLDNQGGSTPVYKITYDPENQHRYRQDDVSNPETLMISLGCQACHTYDGKGGTLGPSLNYLDLIPRLTERLNTQEYVDSLDEIDLLPGEPYVSTTGARQAVRDVRGETRVLVWIYHRLLQPKFDNPDAQMPALGLTKEQAEAIARFLVTDPRPEPERSEPQPTQPAEAEPTPVLQPTPMLPLLERIKMSLPSLRYRYLPFVFLTGALTGVVFIRWFERHAKP
jgi:mono/diheme cytochrome c family protein